VAPFSVGCGGMWYAEEIVDKGDRSARRRGGQRTRSRGSPLALGMALEMARLANEALARKKLPQATIVGRARRAAESMDELSLLAEGPLSIVEVAAALRSATACSSVTIEGSDRVSMRFEGGGPAHLRVVPPKQYLEALVRDTGAQAHVAWLEWLAKRARGLHHACSIVRTERELYALLGVPFAPPELRERPTPLVPTLIEGVRGIFHVHTTWSDGTASIAEMARAAANAGFAYVGISEHSQAANYARGLDATRLHAQRSEMELVRREVPEIVLLHGVEVDILRDGSLDLGDATLAGLDFVVASVHTDLAMPAREMTARLVRAVTHPLVTILGHPTGRLLPGRRGYEFDLDAVCDAAVDNETFLEINASPQRLDLGDVLIRRAAARGVQFAIDPDAHSVHGIGDTGLGLALARRARLASSQVLNARGPRAVAEYLMARRKKAKQALALA